MMSNEEVMASIREDLKKNGPRTYVRVTGRLRSFIETNMPDVKIVKDGLDEVVRFKETKS